MCDGGSRKPSRRFLRVDFFQYMSEALHSKRRRMTLYVLLAVTLVSGFFDTLHWPVLDTLFFLGASGTCIYIGYLLLSVLPSDWNEHLQYRLLAIWFIAVGIGIPLAVLIIEALP